MLFCEDKNGLIALSQPMHARVSGQLARAWGNEQFGIFSPREEVCLGAELHDIGWIDWENNPRLNRKTGRPFTFLEMPRKAHLQIWSAAGPMVLPFGRYAAVLVSLHGSGLYERGNFPGASKETAQAVGDFLLGEKAFREALLATLEKDPAWERSIQPAVLRRNRRLIQVWDLFSLLLCGGVETSCLLPDVLTEDSETDLELTAAEGDSSQIGVSPWPFREEKVRLVFEGKRLPETFSKEQAMRVAFRSAPWVTVETHLRPG